MDDVERSHTSMSGNAARAPSAALAAAISSYIACAYTAVTQCVARYRYRLTEEMHMSKGMDQKKQERKKPAKSLEEKRAAKKAKREARSSSRAI